MTIILLDDQATMIAKECKRCHVTRPLSEFYLRKNSGHPYSYCKDCTRSVSNEANKKNHDGKVRVSPANPHEKLVMQRLMELGIPVEVGRQSRDLRAFGCISIEVKLAMEYYAKNQESFRMNFTPNQISRKMDIIVLVFDDSFAGWENVIFYFDGDNPKFFREDGLRLQGKIYSPMERNTNNLSTLDIRDPMLLIQEKLAMHTERIRQEAWSRK